jgi:Protein of unknown function (DUF3592)
MRELLFAVVILSAALVIGCVGWSIRLFSEAAWPKVNGAIQKADIQVVTYKRTNGELDNYSDRLVTYTYQAQNKQYSVTEDFGSLSPKNDLHPGQGIEVCYNPNQPSEARVVSGSSLKLATIALICSVLSLFGFAAGLILLRRRST